jgi:hypothetical protein
MFRSLQLTDHIQEASAFGRIAVWFPFDLCPLVEIAEIVADVSVLWNEPDRTLTTWACCSTRHSSASARVA